jgi:hypothetical protein
MLRNSVFHIRYVADYSHQSSLMELRPGRIAKNYGFMGRRLTATIPHLITY